MMPVLSNASLYSVWTEAPLSFRHVTHPQAHEATSARVTAGSEWFGSLLTALRRSVMILGRGWPGDAQTPRAAAPPAGAGDANRLYYRRPAPERRRVSFVSER